MTTESISVLFSEYHSQICMLNFPLSILAQFKDCGNMIGFKTPLLFKVSLELLDEIVMNTHGT